MHRGECCKNSWKWVLFREAVSDQVICCAPVINSQIQSGMSGELTCSSFHTLANRSAQWAENQYRVRLKIVHPSTDCPLNNNTTTAVGQNVGFCEREGKKEKSIKWTSYSIRSSALDLHCTHLFPVLPGHTGTWQHQEEILTELKAKREIRETERCEQAGPALDKHTSLIFCMHMWETGTGDMCSGLTHTLQQSWHWPKPDSRQLKYVFMYVKYVFNDDILVIVFCKSKVRNLKEWNLNFEWDHGEQRKGNVADNANLPHLVCTLQLHSVTLPSNLQLIRPKYPRIVNKIHQNNLDINISLQGGCSLTEVTKC